jgi:hypothetical protein
MITDERLKEMQERALVSSGVAKSMEEAEEFLTILLTGLSYAVHKGELSQEDVANTALKTGFYIGLLAGRPNESAN